MKFCRIKLLFRWAVAFACMLPLSKHVLGMHEQGGEGCGIPSIEDLGVSGHIKDTILLYLFNRPDLRDPISIEEKDKIEKELSREEQKLWNSLYLSHIVRLNSVRGHPTEIVVKEQKNEVVWEADLIKDDVLQFVGQCPNVTKLFLSRCHQVTDIGLSYISGMEKLHGLELYYDEPEAHGITEAGLHHISKLTGLKHLYIKGITEAITDTSLSYLSNLSCLESLCLVDCCHNITDNGLFSLSRLSGLKKLFLSDAFRITSYGIQLLAQGCNKLTQLSLGGASITGDALQYLPRTITSLDLQSTNITDEGLCYLHPTVTFLNLKGCTGITVKGIKKLRKRIPALANSRSLILDDSMEQALRRCTIQ